MRARLRQHLTRAVDAHVTPGAVVEVGSVDGPVVIECVGALTDAAGAAAVEPDTVYDLASLTKVIVAGTLAMRHASIGSLPVDTAVTTRWPRFAGAGRDGITVGDLLAHASGLPAYRAYFRAVAGVPGFQDAVAAEPLVYEPRTGHQYSDVGFMLLGWLLADAGGAPLDAQFAAWLDEALPGTALTFHVPATSRAGVAPTEAEPWRGRVLVGEVHDANAAALGGVAGHAGLFGTAPAVGAFARWFLRAWQGRVETSAGIAAPVVARFAARGEIAGSSRALAWDTMLPTSSCGRHFSATAVGHTGFTGTSLWIDPVRDLYVVLLTNRVHPRIGTADDIQALRIAVHETAAEGWPA